VIKFFVITIAAKI